MYDKSGQMFFLEPKTMYVSMDFSNGSIIRPYYISKKNHHLPIGLKKKTIVWPWDCNLHVMYSINTSTLRPRFMNLSYSYIITSFHQWKASITAQSPIYFDHYWQKTLSHTLKRKEKFHILWTCYSLVILKITDEKCFLTITYVFCLLKLIYNSVFRLFFLHWVELQMCISMRSLRVFRWPSRLS